MRAKKLSAMGAVAALLLAGHAQAEVLHMQPNLTKSEIHATVAEPLGFLRDHPMATGSFDLIAGEIDGDPDNVAKTGHVKLVINASTYNSGDSARDHNVIGAALESGKYQTIVFDSVRLEDVQVEVPAVSGTATVVGYLTLHGTRKLMKIPVRVSMSTEGEFSAGGEFSLRYTDFGVKRPRLLFVLPVSDEVTVSFRILAQKPGAEPETQESRREELPQQSEMLGLADDLLIR